MLTLFQEYSGMFFEGFKFTIYSSVIALFFSLIIGTLMAILQLSSNRIIKFLAQAYVEFFRNIPLLIIAMFFFVVVPFHRITSAVPLPCSGTQSSGEKPGTNVPSSSSRPPHMRPRMSALMTTSGQDGST